MIVLIDNYDSFTYNLYQQLSRLGAAVEVLKNDACSLEEILDLQPEKIVLSPGPRTPKDSGICIPLIQAMWASTPILGICLGHQCLAAAFGSAIIPAQHLVFGKTTPLSRTKSRMLAGLPDQFSAARYHSLVIDKTPPDFSATSYDSTGDIMSIEHDSLPLFGLQFHPESFLMLEAGDIMIKNFLRI